MPSEIPVPKSVGLCEPEIGGNEWKYVKECLDSTWVSSAGSYVDRFEESIASFVGARHGVATVNGTAAIHVALLLAGVEPDDEVLVSTLTFIAPVNAVRYCGAWPVLVDAEPDTWQMDPERVRRFLEDGCTSEGGILRNRATGRRVRALLPVHILGHPVDLDPLLELARRFDLPVVEDATEGLGAFYKGRHVGTFGDFGCFSFNGNKMITTGGGGMIVTDCPDRTERARYLTTQAKDDPVEYVHGEIGFNYRLTNLQAAMGCAQAERLPEFLAAKERIARAYDEGLSGLPGVIPMRQAQWAKSAWWLYTALFDPERCGTGRRRLMELLRGERIQTRPLWQPIHLSPVYRGCQVLGGEVSERLNRQALSLPCSAGLDPEAQARVIALIRSHCLSA